MVKNELYLKEVDWNNLPTNCKEVDWNNLPTNCKENQSVTSFKKS